MSTADRFQNWPQDPGWAGAEKNRILQWAWGALALEVEKRTPNDADDARQGASISSIIRVPFLLFGAFSLYEPSQPGILLGHAAQLRRAHAARAARFCHGLVYKVKVKAAPNLPSPEP